MTDTQTQLPTRLLGSHGPLITTIGLGAWAIGGGGWVHGWGLQDDDASIAAIHHAVDEGVTWIDTAPIYGRGHSELIVGKAIRDLPAADRPLIFTKCGVRWYADPYREPLLTLRPETMRIEVEDSLYRLGVECIDLYQCHQPDETGIPIEETWGEMSRFVDEGMVRFIGVSNFNIGLLDRAEKVRHIDSIQPPLSMVNRSAAADVIPWADVHGTGIIAYSPLLSGLLTGTFSRERLDELPADDWRRRSEKFQEPRFSAALALVHALRPIAERCETTVTALAIAWTLHWPGVTGAIVGARSAPQVNGWGAAARLSLDTATLAEIAEAISTSGAGSGPLQPPTAKGGQS